MTSISLNLQLKNTQNRLRRLIQGLNDRDALKDWFRLRYELLNSARTTGLTIDRKLQHLPAGRNDQFDPVSPTAKIVDYLRSLDGSLETSSIEFSDHDGRELLEKSGITNPATQAKMAVLFQHRYHAVNIAITGPNRECKQVLELASGISPRGYRWAKENPGSIYIESDLPRLMAHKSRVLRHAYQESQALPLGVHHCRSIDATDLRSLMSAINRLDTRQAFTIVTEGLLLYFDEAEMRSFLKNISAVLRRFPKARWVTDFVTKQNLDDLFAADSSVARGVKSVFAKTGRRVVADNPFQDDSSIERMIADFGIEMESTVALRDTAPCEKPTHGVTASEIRRIVGGRQVWRLRAKSC